MQTEERAVAIVGVGAILPDAPSVDAFWRNILSKKYSISDVPPERWSVADYYDPDPKAPDKTYSKIGGWVRGFSFDWKRFRVPPKVAEAMDQGQQWAVTIAADALADYGYPERPLNTENTAVIIGTAMGGELHYHTHLRIVFPEYAHALENISEFEQLPADLRHAILTQWRERIGDSVPPITEDTMPGELPNIVSGRIANMLNLRGPNFITDAACASSFAAVDAAVELLTRHQVDAVVAGGVDRNMGVSSFVKFCKIGALSATGSRPFGEGADGFVMGEGSAVFVLKRLSDAERSGDRIYAVIRSVGGASDGKGKGITAPNPIGQRLAVERAWAAAGLDPATATLIEAHGTSTRVGDVVELDSLNRIFGGAPHGSIGLGSAKGNIGHLKAGAGAAGLLKATLALHHKIQPPTLNAEPPNPNFDFGGSAFRLLHEAEEWPSSNGTPRRCGVSAYGFGGTNFHLVLEEHVPGLLTRQAKTFASVSVSNGSAQGETTAVSSAKTKPLPLRGILALGAATPTALKDALDVTYQRVTGGWTPPRALPDPADIRAAERLVIDFGDHGELLDRLDKARKVMGFDNPQAWTAVEAQGIFRGSGPPAGKIAYLFPGQGSQYVNMGRELAELSPTVAEVFAEADKVMLPILNKPLTEYIFVDPNDGTAVNRATFDLMQTEITQPAMLTLDMALYKLLADYGFSPDMVMGHSLGEYAALIAAGIMPFAAALEAAAARGSEMSKVSVKDNGKMAAILAPLDVVEDTLRQVEGYVVPANINSGSQSVIGGASEAVEEAVRLFDEKGYQGMLLPVSHAFHTSIVAPAGGPLREVLDRLDISEPQLPLVANVTGDFYPQTVDAIKDILEKQIASPVQWVKGLQTLYAAGARTFVEVGPKRALRGFARDVLKGKAGVTALMTNHPKWGALVTFNQALCALYAAGHTGEARVTETVDLSRPAGSNAPAPDPTESQPLSGPAPAPTPAVGLDVEAFSQAMAQAMQQVVVGMSPGAQSREPFDTRRPPAGSVVISGTGLGLPGAEKPVMDPDNAMRILRGEQFVDLIPDRFRRRMVKKNITRLVKAADGSGSFEVIHDTDDVIKLAGRPGSFDLAAEYGVPGKLLEALDITTQLAMAAGLDALREAGIPLVQTYRRTTTGKYLPDRWVLPPALRDETGVIFASAFPGGDRFADEFERYYQWQMRLEQLEMLEDLRRYTQDDGTLREINRRIAALREEMEREPYVFDRRFLFRILCMGHSQFAQYIGARGPNAHVNAACASTAQGIALAEDWIRNGRCRRVVVIGADAVTGDNLMEWVGAGFLAVGAVTTSDRVEEAALPFDQRRHGTILGMGACGLIVESEDAVRERGMRGIVELLSSETSNSAFHGTRLDVNHIALIMENLVTTAERRFGLNRFSMAAETVFMSHETFTPARGGSASAEVVALRETFGETASDIIIANTKGFTGHPMGVGVEDVIAVKILEHGIVPPVPNFKEVDPELGPLNLSRGGRYPVRYALHLAAGFGSQIAMTLTRRIPGGLNRIDNRGVYDRWLVDISGYNRAEAEVVQRVLRVKAQGTPPNVPAPSRWEYGTGPLLRTPVADGLDGAPGTAVTHPARMAIDAPAAPTPTRVETTPPPMPKPERRPVRPARVEPPPEVEVAPEPPAVVETAVVPPQDPIAEQVVNLVAQQTGYPADMLDLDLDLEADLGIDTVKQAETFQAIREEFEIPRRDDMNLREYNTLEKVIEFVRAAGKGIEADPVSVPEHAPRPAPEPAPTEDAVAAQVLALVAEQTGYPVDMLELDLDLEADLGIDTVKQAETFLAIREKFEIPRRDDMNLREYSTLEKVIEFVKAEGNWGEVTPASTSVPLTPAPEPAPTEDAIAAQVLALVAEQTGYPIDMLELDLDLEADLGIDTVKQAETFLAIREKFGIPRRDDMNLREYNTLEKVIEFVKTEGNWDEVTPASTSVPLTPAPEPAPTEDAIAAQVLALVAEQTGYPVDMLELDLDLEADLGIDTVKQAETFLAIREKFGIPRRDDMNLREYNTLEKVIEFVKAEGKGAAVETAVSTTPTTAIPSMPQAATRTYDLADSDKMPRRVPVAALRPALDLCKPTAVTLGPDSRVVVMPDTGSVARSLVLRLEKLGATVLELDPKTDHAALTEQLQAWLAEGPIQGVYWLPALDVEAPLEKMGYEAWRAANDLRVKKLYTTMRTLYDSVASTGSFLVSGTRLGGLHGYGPDGATAPLGGAVTGFTKAYKRERGDVLIKAVDFAASRKTAVTADQLIAETLTDPGVVEVGYVEDERYAVTLVERPAADGGEGLTLGPDTLFVVTGAAGGITSEIVTDLASASGGTFYLLDLVAPPDRGDSRIALFRSDKDALKQQLIDEAKAAGERPTPAQIDRQLMAIERSEAALRAIEAVEQAGGTAVYHSVNLLDHAAVTAVVDEIRERYGRIDVLVHAGGIEISRVLPNKDFDQFSLVFDIKADGMFSLLKAADGMPLGATVSFSSVAGRFGNSGQTDYSAANDLLCKLTSSLRSWRPATKGIAIDWTAWGGIGMATRGSIPKIMEMAGIDMLPPESGVPTVRRELVAGGFRGEIVVGGSLGILMEEWDETGGLDLDKANAWLQAEHGDLLLIGKLTGALLYGGLQAKTTLDPQVQPFLYDHAMDGTPLLPGVMGTEAFAEMAQVVAPAYAIADITNEQFQAPFKFYRMEPQTLYLSMQAVAAEDGGLQAHGTLRSLRELGKAGLSPQEKVHFTVEVRLTPEALDVPTAPFTAPSAEELGVGKEDIYRIYFHGPAYQVLERVKVGEYSAIGLIAADLPPSVVPGNTRSVMAPRLIEACFQTAGVWDIAVNGRMALPLYIGAVNTYRQMEEAGDQRLYAVVQAFDGGDHYNAQVVDEHGNVYVTLSGYRTVALPGSVSF